MFLHLKIASFCPFCDLAPQSLLICLPQIALLLCPPELVVTVTPRSVASTSHRWTPISEHLH